MLLLPKTRDEQNRVRDWQVLNTSRHYDEILKVAKYYRAETNKKIKRDKVNVLSTFLISLYDYDYDSLQLDITKPMIFCQFILSSNSSELLVFFCYELHKADEKISNMWYNYSWIFIPRKILQVRVCGTLEAGEYRQFQDVRSYRSIRGTA